MHTIEEYQWTPSEPFDVLLHADRTNGKLIAANAFVKVNWAERIDLATGRPVFSDVTRRLHAGEKVELWPRTTGGKNWPPMAFNPRTGLLYFTRLDEGMTIQYNPKLLDYKAGQRYTGAETGRVPLKPGEPFGYYSAIDPLTAKPKWQVPLHDADIGMWAGTLSTAGGLLFTGKQTGEFIAMDEMAVKCCGNSRPAPPLMRSRLPKRTRAVSMSRCCRELPAACR